MNRLDDGLAVRDSGAGGASDSVRFLWSLTSDVGVTPRKTAGPFDKQAFRFAQDDEFTLMLRRGGLFVIRTMPCVGTACDDEEAEEECDRRNCQHWYGSAKAGAYLRGGAGGSVAAHATALCVRGERGREQQHRHDTDAEKTDSGKTDAAHARYWQKTSRLKRKTQKMPMECQYQAVQSTKIWRSSIRCSSERAASAAKSARTPRTRCAPCAPVMR